MRIDTFIRKAFEKDPAIPYNVRCVKAEGLSLRVTFESTAGNRLDLKIYPAGEAPTTCASTDYLDILFPSQGREDLDHETRHDLEGVLSTLAGLDLRPGYDDWQETLGPEADARFICGPSMVEIKLTRRCNQQCIFCKSSARLENYATARQMPDLLQRLSRRADFITFSGGETCLDPLLERHIHEARQAGFKGIEVQTNGMLMKDGGYVRRLRSAGMNNVLVSLHSHLPEVSGAITNLPGGFGETLRGIETLLKAHVHVSLCHVLCSLNYRHFPDYIRFVLEEFPGSNMTIVTSLAIPTHRVRHRPELMPRLKDLAPPLVEGLALCRPPRGPDMRDILFDTIEHAAGALGMMRRPMRRLLSTGKKTLGVRPLQARVIAHCGLPLCFLKGYEEYHDDSRSPGSLPAGHDLVRPEACGPCRWLDRCSGIWKLYAARYGQDEIRPVLV
jgi:pyruvate-formate lyase-activating enzyme